MGAGKSIPADKSPSPEMEMNQPLTEEDDFSDSRRVTILTCGVSRHGKTTIKESLRDPSRVPFTPQTAEVSFFKSIRSSPTTVIDCYDLPGLLPHIEYPYNQYVKEIVQPVHAIIVVLDVSDARSWNTYYKLIREMVHTLEEHCFSTWKIKPVILLVVTKLDLTPREIAPFGRTPRQTWYQWKESIVDLGEQVKLTLWPKVNSDFGELFEKHFAHFVSIIQDDNYGLTDLVMQLEDKNLLSNSSLLLLHNHIKRNLDCIKRDLLDISRKIQEYNMAGVTKKFESSVNDMVKQIEDDLLSLLDPNRPLKLAIIGPSGYGKTSIIRALLNSEETIIKTESPEWVIINDSLHFLDTHGLEPVGEYTQKNKDELTNAVKQATPDVILIVASAQKICDWNGFAPKVKDILDIIKNASNNQMASIVFVITKIDIADNNIIRKKPEETFATWKERFTNDSIIFGDAVKYFSEEFEKCFKDFNSSLVVCTAIEENEEFGISGNMGLMDQILRNAPINTKIGSNKVDKYIYRRKILATKIICGCTSLAAIASLIPAGDVIVVPLITKVMLLLLECLSVHPNRNAKSYEKANKIGIITTNIIRTVCFMTCVAFDFSTIGLGKIISIPVAAFVTSSTVGATGAHAYNYFTEDLKPN